MPRRRFRHLPPDSCYPARDARVTARLLRLRSGLTVRVVESGPPDGTPIVLLPGLGVSAFTYRHQLPVLGDAGYRATAVDLKGHGFSDKPTGRGEYSLEAMVAHVEDVLDAIAGKRSIALVGQSMAGPIAMRIAATQGDRVSALVLMASVWLGWIPSARAAPFLAPAFIDRIAPLFARRWLVRALLRRVYADSRSVSEETVDEYWAPAQFPEFSRAVRALIHDFRWTAPSDAALAKLGERTLILVGARDRVVRRGEKLARRLVGPTVRVIPDAGHAMNEERPEAVNTAILDFLRSRGV